MNEDQSALARFDGTARLFPLPNLVLFPQVIQGLHIFEPRYRQLTSDALESDGLITMVLLRPGFEAQYSGTPAIEQYACLARITHHEILPDGRFNLRIRGISRARILEEIKTDKQYRMARAEPILEIAPGELQTLIELRKNLSEAVLPRFDSEGAVYRHLVELFAGETPLGALCDMLAYALPLELELKQQLLEEPHIHTRAEIMTHALKIAQPSPDRAFPPEFSSN